MEVDVLFHVRPYGRRRGVHPAWFGFSWPEPVFQSWQAFNVDVRENADSYEIFAELPGVPKENIALNLDDGYLHINVKQESLKEEDGNNYLRRERRQMASRRSFYVGNIDPDQVTAKHHNGVLEIKLPKPTSNGASGRQIEIQ